MAIYYLYNDLNRKTANESGKNYWFCYIKEIFNRLGVSAVPITTADMLFNKGDVLFTGPEKLCDADKKAIARCEGLILISFATKDAGTLFGIEDAGLISQPENDFTINGMFRMTDNTYLPVPSFDYAFPVVSPVNIVRPCGSEVLAVIGENPGLTKYNSAYYFSFDLTQTLWVCSAGKPVYEGKNGFNIGRVCDTRIVPLDYDTTVAFGDYYIYIIQTVLARAGYPMLHRLPPSEDGSVPDLLLFFGGDDDATSGAMNPEASRIMYEHNLPYHMNLMPDINGCFVTTPEEFNLIRSRGHELAFHYDFAYRQNVGQFTAVGFKEQLKLFTDTFGLLPVSNVGHCLTHHGWAERCRYQAALGIKGDNSRLGEVDPNDINAYGMYGFAFGTSFPFFAYDDYEHDNINLNFVELVINYYEPRLPENDDVSLNKLRGCIDDAVRFGRTINFFIHPHYITGLYGSNRPVLSAIDEALTYSGKNNYKIIKYGPDKLCLWWHDRAASSVSGSGNDFTVNAAADMIVRIPCGSCMENPQIKVNDKNAEYQKKNIDGLDWLMLTVAKGYSEINIH
jgi:hypothetical protein